MANTNLTGLFADIADAIRGKDGTEAPIAASAFPDRISAITAEAGSGGGNAVMYKIYEYRKPEMTQNQTSNAYLGSLQAISVADYLPSGVDASSLTADNFLIVPNYSKSSYWVYVCATKASSSTYYGSAIRQDAITKTYSADAGELQFGYTVGSAYASKSGSSGSVTVTPVMYMYLDCDVYYVPGGITIKDLTQG